MSIVSNWKSLTPKRYMRKTLKVYEEQQMKEIPGASKKTGTVMHAALTSEVNNDDYMIDGNPMSTEVKVRNHALIHYIAKLAVSNHRNDTFDFAFVQSLLKNGADINAMDKYGQTVFHEVARSWHPDVAEFLLGNGADINKQDKYGRAPLHVAAAVDYVEMVEFLVSKGADMNIGTTEELQTPIHFAAKNNACQSLKALMSYGVDVNCKDYQDRTPLQLAAAMSRSKTAKLLIETGAPGNVYDKDGEMALSLLIIKMPDVAMLALDQLRSEDRINHKKYFFLNYLEGSKMVDGNSAARSPLEAAVASDSVDIIMHPVMQRLIVTKWEKFGKKWAWFDFIINTISAIIWTIMGVTLPLDNAQLYNPLSKTWWRMVLASIALLLTIYEILRQIVTTVRTKRSLIQWKNYSENSLSRDKPFCHPQWPDEARYIDTEIKRVRECRWLSSHDRWVYVDWTALFLIIAAAISHIVFYSNGSRVTHIVHARFMCALLVVIWVRILKFVRAFEATGVFVATFTKMLSDIILALFLIAIIFIPYVASFWIVFGGLSPRPAHGYRNFASILYEVFMLTVLDSNHNTIPFIKIDPFMARILSATYVFFSFVIVLNVIIAMITDTFKRVFTYAQVHAAMERAKTILNIEHSLRAKSRSEYWDYIRLNCSPMVIDQIQRPGNTREELTDMTVCVKETHQLAEQRFGRSFGEDRLSTIEEIVKSANNILLNYQRSKEMLLLIFRRLKNLEDMTMAMKAPPIQDYTMSEKRVYEKNRNNAKDLLHETAKNVPNSTSDEKLSWRSVAAEKMSLKRKKSRKSETAEEPLLEKVKVRSRSKSTGCVSKHKEDILRRKSVGGGEKHLKQKTLRDLGDKTVKKITNIRTSAAGHVHKARHASKDIGMPTRQVNIDEKERGRKTSQLVRAMKNEEQDDKDYFRSDQQQQPLEDENLSDESLMSTYLSNSSFS